MSILDFLCLLSFLDQRTPISAQPEPSYPRKTSRLYNFLSCAISLHGRHIFTNNFSSSDRLPFGEVSYSTVCLRSWQGDYRSVPWRPHGLPALPFCLVPPRSPCVVWMRSLSKRMSYRSFSLLTSSSNLATSPPSIWGLRDWLVG